MRRSALLRLAAFSFAALPCVGTGIPASAEAAGPTCPGDAIATPHSARIGGQEVSYVACAGTLEVADAGGAKLADLFYTAYLVPGGETSERPLAFVWNGGPGADSRLLHLHAMGPKVLSGGQLADNAASPLAVADLVFLDPAGTGFSRAVSEEAAERLYSTTGDITATAEFVSSFRTLIGREASPLYLAGESFGTWRAAGTADLLAESGIDVAGIALISGGIPRGEESDRALMRALSLPNRTATAFALEKLDSELLQDKEATLREAEEWARQVWYPALADPSALDSAKREEIARDLARFHGLDAAVIDRATLWVSPRDFRQNLLVKEGKVLGIFDMRSVSEAADESEANGAIIAYYRESLGYGGGQYAGIETEELPVGSRWQYDQMPITEESLARAMAGEGPPSPSRPWVEDLLSKSPRTRIFVATGLYDSLNSCVANLAAVESFPAATHGNFESKCYEGGHMMYEEPGQADLFGKHLSDFFSNAAMQENPQN